MKIKHSCVPMPLSRILYELAQDMNGVGDVRLSNFEINKATNKSTISIGIVNGITCIRGELVLLFHGKRARSRPKNAHLYENINTNPLTQI